MKTIIARVKTWGGQKWRVRAYNGGLEATPDPPTLPL